MQSPPASRRLKVLGGAIILVDDAPLGGPAAHRHRIALLALLARSRMPVSRDRLIAQLWPEKDTESARSLLRVAVHGLRKLLSEEAIPSIGDQLALDPAVVSCDVAEFEQAIAAQNLPEAASLYGGPFLDGFFLKEAPEFEQWVESERTQLAAAYARVLEQLGAAADARGDAQGAAQWYRTLAVHDPLRADVAMRLMRALAATGDTQSAVRHASVFSALRESAGLDADAAVTKLASELGSAPTPALRTSTYAPPADEVAPVPVAEAPRRRRNTRWIAGAAFALVAASLVVYFATRSRAAAAPAGNSATPRNDANAVAIFPFRVSGADASLAYLRDGMVELLAAEFTGEGGPSAIDPGALSRQLARAEAAGKGLDRESSLTIARELGAARMLMGSVVGTPQHMTATASIIDVATGAIVARATLVEGSADSLAKMVGAISARLLARDEGSWRLSANDPGTTSSDALRAFIDGRAAYHTGRQDSAFRAFAHAIELDSTFVLAAYWLTVNGKMQRPLSEPVANRAAHLAWAGRARLGPARREMLEAMLGTHGPDAFTTYADVQVALERAVANQPTSPEAWTLLGDLYFHRGALAGYPDWATRSRSAFERAVSLDTVLGPVSHLASLAYREGDMPTHARWLAQLERIAPKHSYTLREEYAAAVASARRDAIHTTRARWVQNGDVYRDSYDGFPWAVGILPSSELDSLIDTMASMARNENERQQATYFARSAALNEGRPARSERLQQLRTASDSAAHDFGLLTYAENDSAAAERLARVALGRTRLDFERRCEIALSRLRRSDTTGARRIAAELRTTGIPEYTEAPACAALVDGVAASLVPTTTRDKRVAALQSVDSLLKTQPLGMPSIWNYDVALAFARLGETRAAAAAVARRMIPRSARLAISLRDEGRWLALTGDTAQALKAFKRYLLFRSNPEPVLQPELASVRAQVARLEAHR